MKYEAEQDSEWIHDKCEGVPLIGLLPDSPAEHAGMQPGDLIVAVNGMRTQNVADYIAAKRLCKLAMQVVFVRASVYYEATMHWAGQARAPSPELVAEGQATKIADGGFEPFARRWSPYTQVS
jgi:predicted metalloprotease with PDZ domain